MAARRAARSPARACARVERLARPAGEDITERDSIPTGRLNQIGPHQVTVFGSGDFLRSKPQRAWGRSGWPFRRSRAAEVTVWLDQEHEC